MNSNNPAHRAGSPPQKVQRTGDLIAPTMIGIHDQAKIHKNRIADPLGLSLIDCSGTQPDGLGYGNCWPFGPWESLALWAENAIPTNSKSAPSEKDFVPLHRSSRRDGTVSSRFSGSLKEHCFNEPAMRQDLVSTRIGKSRHRRQMRLAESHVESEIVPLQRW